MRRGERRILLATAVCAIGAPVSAAAWVSSRTQALAGQVGAAGGVPARIAQVDADLTATLRLSGVALGSLIEADAIEASVALDSLLAGALRADEIRVRGPRVALQIDGDGDSDLARVARRLLHHGQAATSARPGAPAGTSTSSASAGTSHRRLRRIVVSSGTLSARIAGVGELTAAGVELIPDRDGVRVITRALRVAGHAGPIGIELRFARSAAEIALPQLTFGRVLAVGGTGAIIPPAGPGPAPPALPGAPDRTAPSGEVRLRDVAVGRLGAGGATRGSIELRATLDDDGAARPLAIDVSPRDRAVAIRGDRLPLRVLAALAPRGVDLDGAYASGAFAARRDAGRTSLELDGTVDGLALDHRVLAPIPVPIPPGAAIHASIAIAPDAVAVSRAAISVGAARFTASGWLRRGAPASGRLELALATAPCGDLLAALPGELRGPLDGLVLGGTLGGRVRLAVDLAAPPGEGVELITAIDSDCRAEAEPPAADVTRLAAPPARDDRTWARLRRMPAHVAAAFVSAEDARFHDHAGFDLDQIARSLEIDLREQRVARGGSTISQQLIKNAFLTHRRSLDRKLQEAILTWRLEARLDKAQILERYLNIIELGPRVHGIAAAAQHWFGASPRELTLRQAAFLAALTAEPTSMSRRVRRAAGLDRDSAARVEVVLRAMHRDGRIDAAQLEAARAGTLHFAATALQQER